MDYLKTGRSYVVRIDRGEEVVSGLLELCKKESIKLAEITGIGACDYVKVGLYDVMEQKYHSKELTGAMEITSLVGNVTQKDGETYLHLHINVSDEELHVYGGHLNECRIAATCELVVNELEGSVGRMVDERIGLNVFKFEK